MKTRLVFLGVLVSAIISTTSFAGESALDAAKKIAGKYMGTWTMFGMADGKVVEKAGWTDVLTAANPTQGDGKAFVEVSDVMTFADGTTRTSTFHEGYVTNPDGTAGDRFYEINGKPLYFKKLTDNDWAVQGSPDEGELWFMGFNAKAVVSASHVTMKTTTYEGDLDTDHVTRVTTVQWKDVDGKLKTDQFVSMKGEHTRVAQ
jgi:hypothetical protein